MKPGEIHPEVHRCISYGNYASINEVENGGERETYVLKHHFVWVILRFAMFSLLQIPVFQLVKATMEAIIEAWELHPSFFCEVRFIEECFLPGTHVVVADVTRCRGDGASFNGLINLAKLSQPN
jgi:hypothetical protein